MEDEQHHPIGVATIAKNNLFSQFHAHYPDHEREHIVKSLVQGVSTIRVLFVTVAFGIGIDINLKI
jgi:superfamily II DNA helicase RecQ